MSCLNLLDASLPVGAARARGRAWAALVAAMMGLLLATLPTRALAVDADTQRLVLSDGRLDIDAWPHVQMLAQPDDADWRVDDALLRLGQFKPPGGRHANLGVQRGVVWLRLPLDVPVSETGRWQLEIDYPSLDRVDVYLVTGGRAVLQQRLGRTLPASDRPPGTRAHGMQLRLEPGQEHELLLRVKTQSSMILPLRLMKPEAQAEREANLQLLQGIATGVGLCMLIYCLAHWASLRDVAYLYYAVAMAGITVFFFAYYGLGMQHVWGANPWLTVNMAPLAVLVALVGGLLFLDRALMVAEHWPRLSLTMQASAALAGLCALAFTLDLISYRHAQLAGTVLGPLPVVLGLPAAVRRMRAGDRAAQYIVLGWGLYAVGIVTMALLLRGLVDFNLFTHHAFQVGAMLEMSMWLRALGSRMEETRRLAERADREREALRTLAHTDPLTGLPNRRGLQLEANALLPLATPERLLAVYLLDLDGFKAVNDRLGHEAGDELLKAVAQRLRGSLRSRDVVARLGGDEFVILASDLPADADARRLGQKLLASFHDPFELRGQAVRVGLTIGYALGPLDGKDEASLLKRADAAMYAGKQAGKHCLRRGAASFGLAGA